MKKAFLFSLALVTALSAAPAHAQTGYFTYSYTKVSSSYGGDWLMGRYQTCQWKVYRTFHSSTGSTFTEFATYTSTQGDTVWFGTPPACPRPTSP